MEDKIVYVWSDDANPFTNRSVFYATNPQLPDYMSGRGIAESIAERIKRIQKEGYSVEFDISPDGTSKPLDPEIKLLFAA